jgi:hypothetical protein
MIAFGLSTPATTSATTYKERFRTNTANKQPQFLLMGVTVTPNLRSMITTAKQ